eukprot:TRINITY_DN3271_c0_g1_i3.p1 TRINITY_DN3271_c0_g1~~TRINITY_DN3271_c0_g1_i3.p1  ORF type:complete len:305 (-),score=37.13 TRINITY_DN3271_c0_g1_i3:27-941(-)
MENSTTKKVKKDKIKLNVGGQKFVTSRETLLKEESMISAMFSGRYKVECEEDGYYFIDRDGTHFRYILNFLRDGTIVKPNDLFICSEILAEARYYQLRGLIQLLTTVSTLPPLPSTYESLSVPYTERYRDGILHWIATYGFTKPWINPHTTELVKVSASSRHSNASYNNIAHVVGEHEFTFYTKNNVSNPWIQIVFPDEYRVRPTHYVLGSKTGGCPLRNWNLEAAENPKGKFDILSCHKDDETIPKNGEAVTFKIDQPVKKSYQVFKIVGTGPNSGKKDPFIGTSVFELFGELSLAKSEFAQK